MGDNLIYTFRAPIKETSGTLENDFFDVVRKYSPKIDLISEEGDLISKYYGEIRGDSGNISLNISFAEGNSINYDNNNLAGLIKIFGESMNKEELSNLPIIKDLEKDLKDLPYKCFN